MAHSGLREACDLKVLGTKEMRISISHSTKVRLGTRVCALAMGFALATPALIFAQSGTLSGYVAGARYAGTSLRSPRMANSVSDGSCLGAADCNDNLPCTSDLCVENACQNLPIPDCVPCELSYECPPVDVVFIMDTSGSMRDEASVLCAQVFAVSQELADMGITALINSIGITEMPGGPFDCLFDTVVSSLGSNVPGELLSCPFPGGSAPYESWGPATAIVAQHYPWTPGATRIIIPMSDEGPCNGSRPEGCNDPGDDRESIDNAIAVALANNVVVSPIAGTSSDACVINLGAAIAKATGGQLHQYKNPKSEFRDVLVEIIHQTCVSDAACDDREDCTSEDKCMDGRCMGTPVVGCLSCDDNFACDDENLCTSDTCVDGFCQWAPLQAENQCCDPDTGALVPISDGNPCTNDACDPATGLVQHSPGKAGIECDDGSFCTVDDVCDGSGTCFGSDLNQRPCAIDQDCLDLGTCNTATGFCTCTTSPSLCLVVSTSPDEECLPDDQPVIVYVRVGTSPRIITGGQFLVQYDPDTLDFVEMISGQQADPESIFSVVLSMQVDETAGTIFFAVSAPLDVPGTNLSALMAMIQFMPRSSCAELDPVCFTENNIKATYVVDSDGNRIDVEPCCSAPIQLSAGPPQLSCPQSVGKNADAGRASSNVTWTAPTATGLCDGPIEIKCSGVNHMGLNIDSMAAAGGRFAIGESTFHCDAIDSCGLESECDWSVIVNDAHTVRVDIELSAPMTSMALIRCIELEFFTNCFHSPLVVTQPVLFGGLFNFPGMAKFTMKVPASQYGCVTARDPLHTLRSTSPLEIIDNQYVIRFRGDPKLNGNWLINGDLNNDGIVDVLDHTLLLTQYQNRLERNTSCEGDLHADLNGDGLVDLSDMAFIERALYATDAGACCPFNTAGSDGPVTEVSVDDPNYGDGNLRRYDLNGDGVIDHSDIIKFLRRELKALSYGK